ncbi:MAG: hypothetical protein ACRBBN_15400 [Methyloligellaceae bacterium]
MSWRLYPLEHLPKPSDTTTQNTQPRDSWNVILLSQQFAKHAILGGNNLVVASGRHELAIKKCAGLKLPKKNRVNTDDDITIPHIDHKQSSLKLNPHTSMTEVGHGELDACDQCVAQNGKEISKGYKGDLICLVEQ